MKVFLLGSCLFFSSLILFTSCQKEIQDPNAGRIEVDSTIIWKYIEFDTTLSSGLDTLSVLTFDYDNNGRLISLKRLDKDFSAPPTTLFPHFRNTVYSYNANDTLPFKVITTYSDFLGNNGNDTTYLFYSIGIVNRDSTRSSVVDMSGFTFQSIAVNRYVTNGNTTVATQYRDQTLTPTIWPPVCPGTTVYNRIVSNGNIVSEIGDYTSCNGIGNSTINLTYDNNPNPFYPLGIPYPGLFGVLDNSGIQKNNFLATWDITPSDGFSYSYTYRSDGYPIIVRAFEVSQPSEAWKGIFIYK
jgi:hypothetical protein